MCRKELQARKRFVNLMKLKNHWVTECFWCHIPIACKELVPKEFKPEETNRCIKLIVNNRKYQLEQLTIDHYFEKRNGWNNQINNLIPSCTFCNSARNEYVNKRIFCIQCEEVKTDGNSKR